MVLGGLVLDPILSWNNLGMSGDRGHSSDNHQ
jgi:hypothetical protein